MGKISGKWRCSVSVWVEPAGLGDATHEVDVEFTCRNGNTFWGQNVYVIGSIEELGGRDADKAGILSSNNYPDWSGTLSNIPADAYIE